MADGDAEPKRYLARSLALAASKAVVKHLTFVVALGFMGLRGFRMSKLTDIEPTRPRASVVIGG